MEPENPFGLGELANLRIRGGNDIRPALLRVLTDLYVHRFSHTADEERHYVELALPMLEFADVPTRVSVARRFARYPSPPLSLLQRLAGDVPEVAAEVNAHPLLPPSDEVAVFAAPTADAEILSFQNAAPDAAELTELFFTASPDERRLILINVDITADDAAAPGRFEVDAAIGRRLEAAALSNDRAGFANQLAVALRISNEHAQRLSRDDLGEPLVVAAKVLNVPREVLCRILMFINPAIGHSVERVHALAALYDEITIAAAESLTAIWQALPPTLRSAVPSHPRRPHDEVDRRARPGLAAQRSTPLRRTSGRRGSPQS